MEACPKKTPFITVVRGGVFNDKTNYIELNKKNRQKVDAKKQSKIVNTASTSSVSTSTQTSATSVSTSTQTSATIEDQNVSFTIVDSEINLETVALEAGVGVISVTNEPSETQEANAGIAPMESQELEIIPSVEINETNLNNSDSIQVESSDSISPDALITAKTDESELNSTFQLLALTENDQQEPVNSLVASSSCEASASDSAEKTPHKTSLENSLNYVSPFVTLSRGKYSAQKEGKVREVKVIKNNEFVPASSELQTFIEADREKLKESQRSEEASSNSKGNRHPMVLRITPAIFRHGDRTPITYYQNDPWKDPKHWEVEPGQLTSLGKQQQFELGKWLQNRYSKLLNETYSSDQIYVSSSDFPRTIMSAEAVLAAMFQSTDYILKTYLPWQPIPVHVIPLEDDYLVAGDAECAIWNKYCKEFLETEENKQFYDRHQPLYDYLSLHAGEKVTRHSPITIRDTLKIEQMYNKTLPDWTKRILAGGDLHSSIEEVSLHSFKLDTSAPSLAKIKGGFLLKDILDRFTNKSKSILEPDRSMWMYSGHDTTIIRILNILGVQESLPPYSACVIFEMRQIDDVPNIQIFFKNSSAIPKLLHIPNCGVLCPLSSFYNLYKDVLPTKAFKEECKDDNAEASCASRVLMQALPAVLSILLTRLISTK